jgi:hypothetical protein
MRLGDYVWFDTNNNGVVDVGEGSVGGVVVELYRDTNGDGVYTPGIDAYVGTQTTNGVGFYQFNGLTSGDYVVVITGTNFAADISGASVRPSALVVASTSRCSTSPEHSHKDRATPAAGRPE